MKLLFAIVCIMCLSVLGYAQNKTEIAIIPQPVKVAQQDGSLRFRNGMTVSVPANQPAITKAVEMFLAKLEHSSGFRFNISNSQERTTETAIRITLENDAEIGKEGYKLDVNSTGVHIRAAQPAGVFYGLQTLLQLLPKEIESKTRVENTEWTVPYVAITDYPRFGWRGMMLDVSRHYFDKEQVKQFIDDMVKYKFNLLHFHLTDDQGWRLEIKSLPKLTEVGAWRVDKTGWFNHLSKPQPGEKKTYGGFFTHDDIRELVKYAADRFVNILPEIDVPGHSMAFVAAYPEVSPTPGKYEVNSGEKFMEWTSTGFYALIDNTISPAKEKTYEYLDKVFTEVAELFPFEYIHMGGDECATNFWEKSAEIKALMKKEGLKNMHEVQSYFSRRVAKIIQDKGKKVIGWDEILEGGLAKGAAVMSWRGVKGGIAAAKLGHEVVMTPSTHVYVDLMQGDAIIEPPVYSSVRLKKSYEFEPVPAGVDARFIKGGQANLWTEQVYNMRHLQYMAWPRTFAVTESLWSDPAQKNWDKFITRVEKHFERFDVAEMKYAPSMYEPVFKVTKNSSGQLVVDMTTEVSGIDIHYSFDNSFPDQYYPKYAKPLVVPKDALNMKVVSYRNGKKLGRDIHFPISELQKRVPKK
ncbi:MAG: beta-N-acetylhexosaminidase [Chitinophagaceae bacterium]|nr:MAG: beta-N-acetylhexosaminidase [Chitinophagaceae bacterium]